MGSFMASPGKAHRHMAKHGNHRHADKKLGSFRGNVKLAIQLVDSYRSWRKQQALRFRAAVIGKWTNRLCFWRMN